MEQKKTLNSILHLILYVALYILIQSIVQFLAIGIYAFLKDIDYTVVLRGVTKGFYSQTLAISTMLSGMITIILFVKMKWSPVSRNYLQSRPWGTLFWAAMLGIGSILPAQFIYEQMEIALSETTQNIFEGLMKEPWGYAAVGIIAPVGEEIIFRGAILRTLLGMFDKKFAWIAIFLSALLFGVIHGNVAQCVHALLLGIALGWMYYRTGSILPGIVLHWVNNSIAYALYNLLPQTTDNGELITLFHGSEKMMYGGLFFSLCILIPSIFQLAMRMKRH